MHRDNRPMAVDEERGRDTDEVFLTSVYSNLASALIAAISARVALDLMIRYLRRWISQRQVGATVIFYVALSLSLSLSSLSICLSLSEPNRVSY